VLRPGSVQDVVYLRAILDSTVPQIQSRTAGLRGQLARSRKLHEQSLAAAEFLRAEEARLGERQKELAALEARQRLASREASGTADREAERVLALAEEARDLDALVTELDRAGELRTRLASLSGPLLRCCAPRDPNRRAWRGRCPSRKPQRQRRRCRTCCRSPGARSPGSAPGAGRRRAPA
jgi:hypothetical protein